MVPREASEASRAAWSNHANARPEAGAGTARPYTLALLGILVGAGVWRGAMAAALPSLSRDGVTFCWYARELERQGTAFLRAPTTHQHPLFPLLLLGTRAVALACGAPDTPLTWQRSGQLVAWLSGMLVVWLAAAATRRLVRVLQLPLDERVAALSGAGLAALLPLNIELSADVMSDQLHLAFYLAGVLVLLQIHAPAGAPLCGVLAGLAFVTRPEGAVVLVGGVAAAIARVRLDGPRQLLARGALLATGFVLIAGPFWAATGRLMPKKNPVEVLRGEHARPHVPLWRGRSTGPVAGTGLPAPAQARLLTYELGWYEIPVFATYMTFRAGRVVVPLLALASLLHVRRRLLGRQLAGLSTCFVLHAGLVLLLLYRWKYLAPRHTLVLVALLLPFAAILLAWLRDQLRQKELRRLVPIVLTGCLLPLGVYALRVPNAGEGFLPRAAAWLVHHDPAVGMKLLSGGNGQKRIAFYADMRWTYWLEDPDDFVRIRRELLAQQPNYFALETGLGEERRGHDRLLERLAGDPDIGPWMREIHTDASTQGGRLHVFALAWPGS